MVEQPKLFIAAAANYVGKSAAYSEGESPIRSNNKLLKAKNDVPRPEQGR